MPDSIVIELMLGATFALFLDLGRAQKVFTHSVCLLAAMSKHVAFQPKNKVSSGQNVSQRFQQALVLL